MAESLDPLLTFEERKQRRELDDLRKSGIVRPEVDAAGQMVNPHIPQYLMDARWYTRTGREEGAQGLKHLRYLGVEKKKYAGIHERAITGQSKEKASEWREGQCENCGARTHATKQCMERPRKKGARWTQSNFAHDDIIPEKLELDYEGKNDRWQGYDPRQYAVVVRRQLAMERKEREERLEALEEELRNPVQPPKKKKRKKKHKNAAQLEEDERRRARAERRKKRRQVRKLREELGVEDAEEEEWLRDTDDDDDDDDVFSGLSSDEDDDVFSRLFVGTGEQRSAAGGAARRHREDTAKFLLDLSATAAYFDPRSRALRLPKDMAGTVDPEMLAAAENSKRLTGDAAKFRGMQEWTSKVQEHDVAQAALAVHMQANPTRAEKLYREHFLARQGGVRQELRDKVAQRYGGLHQQRPDEAFVVDSGADMTAPADAKPRPLVLPPVTAPKETRPKLRRTRYEEDVYENGHSAVFGSFFDLPALKWGYACCRSCDRHARCTAAPAEEVERAGEKRAMSYGATLLDEAEDVDMLPSTGPQPNRDEYRDKPEFQSAVALARRRQELRLLQRRQAEQEAALKKN